MGKRSAKQERPIRFIEKFKQGVTTEQAISMLQKKGIEVDEKDAKTILDFLYILGKLAVNQYFNSD